MQNEQCHQPSKDDFMFSKIGWQGQKGDTGRKIQPKPGLRVHQLQYEPPLTITEKQDCKKGTHLLTLVTLHSYYRETSIITTSLILGLASYLYSLSAFLQLIEAPAPVADTSPSARPVGSLQGSRTAIALHAGLQKGRRR